MELVIDANIIFAALIKDSHTRDIIINRKTQFCIPEFLFDEVKKYLSTLAEKTDLSEDKLLLLLETLLVAGDIAIIPLSEFKDELDNARTYSPDPDDVHYFALALKQRCAIWSNDKNLKGQNKIAVYTTREVSKILDF